MTHSRTLSALAVLAACLSLASVTVAKDQVVHSKTFSSPVELASGDVVEHYKRLEFPEGHIALRNFSAEVGLVCSVTMPT